MLSELNGVGGKHPLGPDEVVLGRDALTRSFPESFDNPSSIAGMLETMATFGLPDDYLSTYLATLAAVPAAEVVATFARLADPKARVVVVVGDRKSVEPKLKTLGLGEVRVVTPDGKPAAP